MNLEDSADRERSLPFGCGYCGVEPGEVCVRPDGEQLRHVAAHPARLAAAGVVHAPIDTRELRGA